MYKIIVLSLIGLFFFTTSHIYGQIESGKVVSSSQQETKPKKKKPKKERIPRTEEDVKNLPFIFVGGGVLSNSVINRETTTIYGKPLGIKAEEVGRTVPIAGMSYKVVLDKGFYLSFGIDYSQSGEKFSWKASDSDSSFAYKNTYHLLSIPIGINYIYGKKVQLLTGLGIAPNLTAGSRNKTEIITTEKTSIDTKTSIQERMNDFNISAYFQLGVQFKVGTGVYFFILPEARYSLMNTLNKQASYQRKFWQIGAQAGISFNL